MPTDYYELLGVSPTAADAVIRAAFRTLVADAASDQPRFAALTEAFEVLKDPERRAAYDRERAARPGAGSDRTVAEMERTIAGFDRTVAGANSTVSASTTGGALVPYAASAESAPVLRPDTCSACGTPTPTGTVWCPECGLRCGTVAGQLAGPGPLPPPTVVASDGRTWTLTPGENTVGRERSDIVLNDPSVSRRHARLTVGAQNRVVLEDLGSTNGTRLGAQRIGAGNSVSVSDGASVVFGNVAVTVRIASPPGPTNSALPAAEAAPKAPVAAIGGQAGAVPCLVSENGTIHRLTASSTILGRKSDCGLVVTGDSHVSGHHARIDWSGGVCRLTDLGSTNGSRVGAERVDPAKPVSLTDGVTITLGNTRFTFRMSG